MADRLILLHGWLGDPGDFEGLQRHLPEMTGLSLPGHGKRVLDARATTESVLEGLAEDIERVADTGSYVLGGYSMGGRAAAWLTATGRLSPQALVLIAASPGLPTRSRRDERRAVDEVRAQQLRDQEFTKFLDRWYRLPLFADLRHGEDFEATLQRRLQRDPQQCARALELLSVGNQPDLTEHDFEREVLYIAGLQDRKYADLATGWKNVRAELIPGAGHAVHLQRPDEVAARIREMESLK